MSNQVAAMTPTGIDSSLIEEGVRLILKGIGEDPEREGLRETPQRVGRMYGELFAKKEFTATRFTNEEKYEGFVIEQNIQFCSFCEHHMLPFFGTVALGYLPGASYLGLSKLARVVEQYSRRLQVQERLTEQLAQWLMQQSGSVGAAAIIKARHLCLEMRGVQKVGTETVTLSLLGTLKSDQVLAERFLRLAGSGY